MNSSEQIGALAAALAKAQGAMGAALKDADNPFFKSRYADLASIVAAIKEPLSTNGLAYIQTTDVTPDWNVSVETVLLHASGQWISGTLTMKPSKSDPQGIGSCITYARRYGLQAMVGIPADDDDGNAASGNSVPSPEQQRRDAAPYTPPKAATPRQNVATPAPAKPTPIRATSELPSDPEEAASALIAEIDKIDSSKLPWGEGVNLKNKIEAIAKSLAITLRTNGLTDAERASLYHALTTKESGKDMTPAQLVVLQFHAGEVAVLQGIAKWWAQNRPQAQEGGLLI